MIRIATGDLVQVAANNRFYYALILEKISCFGGQFCFVFYQTSESPLPASEILKEPMEGFYETVDFIWAKRENRIERIAKKIDVEKLNAAVTHFRNTHPYPKGEKAKVWFISERYSDQSRMTYTLTEEEKHYPPSHRIDDIIMVDLVDERWSPEKDPRI